MHEALMLSKKDEKCAYSGRKIVTKETQEGVSFVLDQ